MMTKKQKQQMKKILHYGIWYIAVPFLLELVIESLSRKSVMGGILYFFDRPVLCLFNTLIIMLTVSVALFFKREVFVYTLVSAIWLIFGVVNFVTLHLRVTPFSAVDITLLESAISVSGHYLNIKNIIMIVIAIVVVFVSMSILYRKAPKHEHRTQKKLILSGIAVALLAGCIFFIRSKSNSVQALATNYTNISEAYENYGFVYCFTNSIIDTGISKPDNYSKESVDNVLNTLNASTYTTDTGVRPNIIFIQLESFFDVDMVKDLELSKDAIPNFHKLQKSFSNGFLTVPTVGAGTVNTEFEMLTGMSQRDFGTSEYPYKTILRKTAAESICYDLKQLGYASHCVHNNEGTFYGRNKVFKNLGFDTFASMEYMNGLEDNPNGWKKDRVLTGEILKTLDSTQGPDFTLGLSVQSHGKYKGFSVEDASIRVKKVPESGDKDSYQYYVNQLSEVDEMIGNLVNALEQRNEKTILVLYGDHLPSLDIKKTDLKDSNLYQTQYVIWDNLGLKKISKNLSAYQMYSYVLNKLGIHEGNITKFHQAMKKNTKTYHNDLKMLEYDMLYGEQYAYNGTKPYTETLLQMGTYPVTVTNVERNDRGYLVTGSNFTPYAHLLFNGDEVSTEWVDANHIQILETLEYDQDAANEQETASPAPTQETTSDADADQEEKQKEEEAIPNAFIVQIQTDGGTVLSDSEPLKWEDTSLGKETAK